MTSKELVKAAVAAIEEKKGEDIKVIDISGVSVIADYFILHRDDTAKSVSLRNLIIWAIGFALYRLLMQVDLPVGNTLPDMLITALICCAANIILPKKA